MMSEKEANVKRIRRTYVRLRTGRVRGGISREGDDLPGALPLC